MLRSKASRRTLAVSLSGMLAATLAACGGGSDGGGDAGGNQGGATFVFGGSADPVILDGAYVSDGESLRAIRQIFDGLVTTEAGGTKIVPALAESWESSPDGLQWTFQLRDGVKFHDGTEFNGEAVCANFDRWYNFEGVQQSPSVAYYWTTVFGGFAKNEDKSLGESLYKSCEAGDGSATITLARPSSTFVSALSLPAFSIASPKALEEFKADEVSGTGEAPQFTGTFGTEHPVGTGAFKFKSWEKGNQLVLERNDDYWGEKAKVSTLVFKPIADGPARRRALESGDIDGYDLVDPADVGDLEAAKFQVVRRPAFNVGYVGFNQKQKPLDNPKIRQAIAHAIDRQSVLQTNYPEGAVVAKQFMPPEVFGYAEDVPTYDFDLAKAKQLIQESGVTNPTIEFWYPTDVSRPYMPDPAKNFELMRGDLEEAGFKVIPKTAPWNPQYLDVVDSGKAAVYLLGWTGDFGDPDNFIGTFFQAPTPQWGFKNPEIHKLLSDAEAETDEAKRTQLYQEANRKIMEFLPGIPYVHTEPALAFTPGVKGFVASPTSGEDFSTVSVAKQ